MRGTTRAIILACREELRRHRPMTVRQLYYQMVVQKVLPNSQSSYKMVVRAMVRARQEGMIPWDWIEDRLRRPRGPSMWRTIEEYLETVKHAFRADIWEWQPRYCEFWLEKEALAGIFEGELREYGVTLNVGRGYDGWSSLKNAAARYRAWAERRSEIEGEEIGTDRVTIVYAGDQDPSGQDMVRSLEERLNFFDVWPKVIKSCVTPEDIEYYNLPPDPTKTTDSRAPAFIAQYGAVSSVELDALPVEVLRQKIRDDLAANIDQQALSYARDLEEEVRLVMDRAVDLARGGE
jgi:hypothetical protein